MGDQGWIGVENKDWLRPTAIQLRMCSAPTTFQWVKGHSDDPGNEGADQKAKEGVQKSQVDNIDLSVDPRFDMQGAKLACLTQSLAYAGILEQRDHTVRRKTQKVIEMIQISFKSFSQYTPTSAMIWKSIRSKDFRRNISDFLWKSTHDIYRVGGFWTNIPGYQDRVECSTCQVEESMTHILTECNSAGQQQIWTLAKELLQKKAQTWPEINLGTILGCGLYSFKFDNDKTDLGKSRLFRIVISESAFLIWKLRNERRIARAANIDFQHSSLKIRRLWIQAMNTRLTLDREMTNKRKYGKKALSQNTVLRTWQKTLKGEADLPDNWISSPEVLVGMVFCLV
ncbi:hypothetical protein K474DRAFT_1692645 [Panus rudis PR-1116 ss-1]|nr:hypothetical protein K474DRAFT_1692645 [Panus rudis PR-1116 ss-1]